jgi:uncharacterized membrane protein
MIQFHDPFLVYCRIEECDDVPGLLSQWKTEYLVGDRLDAWNRLPHKRSHWFIRTVVWPIKTFWPLIALSIMAAYLPFTSVCFASVVLLTIQAVIFVKFGLRVWEATCVVGAFELEKRDANPTE